MVMPHQTLSIELLNGANRIEFISLDKLANTFEECLNESKVILENDRLTVVKNNHPILGEIIGISTVQGSNLLFSTKYRDNTA